MKARHTSVGLMVAGIALLGAGALTACSGSAAPAETSAEPLNVDAAWLDGGRMIGVVTWGSSSCVPVAEEATLVSGAVEVALSDTPTPTGGDAVACTADYAPRVSLVGVPAGVDPAQGVEVHVTLLGSSGVVALPAAAGLAAGGSTDYQPSAGWTTQPGMLAYLTWGSSSCPPAVQDVAATGDAQVTITFSQPPADRMCTMDMAPRAGLVEVEGPATASGAQLVLTGDQYDNVTLPIAG